MSFKKSYCADLRIGLEFNSEQSRGSKVRDENDVITGKRETRPRLFINYRNQIAQTEILGNLKIDYKREKNSETYKNNETNERVEPSFDIGLRSEIYQLNLGLNETRERTDEVASLTVNEYRFGEGILQPKNFPGL